MIKFDEKSSGVVCQEIPDKISFAFSITNCCGTCVGCHSPWLREDMGTELTEEIIDKTVKDNYGINCILFLGEGKDKKRLLELAQYVKSAYNDAIAVAVYSGREIVDDDYYWVFDYIKTGPYIEEFGPLNKETTNQKLMKKVGSIYTPGVVSFGEYSSPATMWDDITYLFWKKF